MGASGNGTQAPFLLSAEWDPMYRAVPWIGSLVLALCLTLTGCSSSTTGPSADAPEGHTVMKSGVAHASGLDNPAANCASCHGANLQGGSAGQPSCFSCHGKKW